MAETKPITVSLVGCGDISSSHLKSYEQLGIKVVALCDLIRPRAERRRDEFKLGDVPIFEDHQEMLKAVQSDLVTVATPVACHIPITINALRAGRHVACEKPSALSVAENKVAAEEARKADRKLIFFSARMRGAEATLAREYIQAGELGDIYRVHVQFYRRRGRPGVDIIPNAKWFVDQKQAGGGIIMDMGQYFMDMVFDLTGWPQVDSASGYTFRGHAHDLPPNIPFDVEEHCTIQARAGHRCYSFDLAWISHHPQTRIITILGTKGGIKIDGDGFHFHTERGGPWRFVDTSSPWKDKMGGNEHCYENLIKAIRGEKVSYGTTPEQALTITRLTQAAFISDKEKREVRLCEVPDGMVDPNAYEEVIKRTKALWASGAIK